MARRTRKPVPATGQLGLLDIAQVTGAVDEGQLTFLDLGGDWNPAVIVEPRRQVASCTCGAPMRGLLAGSCGRPACTAEAIRADVAFDRSYDD